MRSPSVEPTGILLVLKVGGSLVSDKRTPEHLSTAAITRWAGMIADLAAAAPGRVVLVAGGGAIGHAAVRSCPEGGVEALPLTEATFRVKTAWAEALRRAGAVALPLQVAAIAGLTGDQPRLHSAGVFELLGRGVLPVLSGDVVATDGGGWRVLGSDRVPELLLDYGEYVVRVVMLTDVPGVLRDPDDPTSTVPYVDPARVGEITGHLRPSGEWDTTGGMAGKLAALARLARRGAECFVLGGGPELADLRFLVAPAERWPPGLRCTRIALPLGVRPCAS